MAQSTVLNLLTYAVHTGSLPLSIAGEKQQAAAYYIAGRDLQTITWSLGSNINSSSPVYFVGNIVIQASLSTSPGVFDWFDAYALPISNSKTGQSGYYNLYGNYVWIRAVVTQWTQGPIQSVAVSF